MADRVWFDLMLLLSLVTGTVALTLSVLTWRILRESAVGRTVLVLTAVLALFSFYHGIALLLPQSELFTSILKSITLTGVVLFIAFTIRFERSVVGES